MISKKLYESVIELDYRYITREEYEVVIEGEKAIYRNKYTLFEYDEISIYNLAHKCKEWASKKNYALVSWTETEEEGLGNIAGHCVIFESFAGFDEETHTVFSVKPISEPEAIFKACEWILNQMEES